MKVTVGLLAVALSMAAPQARSASPTEGLETPAAYTAPMASGVDVLQGAMLRASRTGVLRLAYRDDTIPFSFVPAGRTRPVGYAIDLCRLTVQAIAEHLKRPVHIEWVSVEAVNRFQVITDGQADLLCGSTSDTPERRQWAAFSPPLFITGGRLLVPVSSPVRHLRALGGQTVAVVAGTTVEQQLPAVARHDGVTIRMQSYPDYRQAYAALSEGVVAGLMADEVLLAGLLMQPGAREAFRMTDTWRTHEVYGLAYHREDKQLDSLVRSLWRRLAADGRLEGAYHRWFQRRLPGGGQMDLPMSLPLRTAFDMLSVAR